MPLGFELNQLDGKMVYLIKNTFWCCFFYWKTEIRYVPESIDIEECFYVKYAYFYTLREIKSYFPLTLMFP
jgi:hypothetical protein